MRCRCESRAPTNSNADGSLTVRKELVSESSLDKQGKILAFAAVVEGATGFVLMIDPADVVALLIGVEAPGAGTLLARCFGISLLALGLACWPGPQRAAAGGPTLRGMLVYNVLIALYLAFLGTVNHLQGTLLWPAVALHAAVALILVWAWRGERSTKATNR